MGLLYIIKCNTFHKVGIATNIEDRLIALQTGNPYKLELVDCFELPNAFKVEQSIHRKYAQLRELGEWFRLGEGDVRSIQAECVALGGVRRLPADDPRKLDGIYLHTALAKVAIKFFVGIGLIRREDRENKIILHFDMSQWTEGLDLR